MHKVLESTSCVIVLENIKIPSDPELHLKCGFHGIFE